MNRQDRRRKEALDRRLGRRELLYGGRTLNVKICLDTDETGEEAIERMRRPLSGPRKVMVLIGVRLYPPDEGGSEFWRKTAHLFVPPMTPKHDGQMLEVDVFLNTDEPVPEVQRRAQEAAPGPRVGLSIVSTTDELDPEGTEAMWKKTWQVAEDTVMREN